VCASSIHSADQFNTIDDRSGFLSNVTKAFN
jgi:hypothetical protein